MQSTNSPTDTAGHLLFDSHLDLAWNALSWRRDLLLPLHEMNRLDGERNDHPCRGRATISFPELRRTNMAVCLATVMGRVPYGETAQVHAGTLDFPCHEATYGFAQGQLAYYRVLQRQNVLRLLRTSDQLRQHWAAWEQAAAAGSERPPLGVILAMEGCDAICEPVEAELWYDDGLRCASLVHYGRSKYASGTGDDGPVTAAGYQLLDEFSRLGMVLDTTHLCDQSFFQALDHFGGAVVASHQNCRAIVPGQRQFTDEQLERIIQRGGVVGLAFDAWMMYPEGWERGITSRNVVGIEAAVDHADHICQLAGSDRHVAIGSDLDGGFGTEQCPNGLDTIADLQKLPDLLSDRGYQDDSIRRIMGTNWLEFFVKHLPGGS